MNIETIAMIISFSTALYSIVYGAYDLMQE
jgi:hypothetical protein